MHDILLDYSTELVSDNHIDHLPRHDYSIEKMHIMPYKTVETLCNMFVSSTIAKSWRSLHAYLKGKLYRTMCRDGAVARDTSAHYSPVEATERVVFLLQPRAVIATVRELRSKERRGGGSGRRRGRCRRGWWSRRAGLRARLSGFRDGSVTIGLKREFGAMEPWRSDGGGRGDTGAPPTGRGWRRGQGALRVVG